MAKGQMRSTREKKKPKSDKTKAAAKTPTAGAIAAQKWNKTPVGPKKKGG